MTSQQRLILTTGISGSGKSTLSRQLARIFSLPYLDYDTLTEPFLHRLHAQYDQDLAYSQFCSKWRDESYAVFWNTIAETLHSGVSVIASAPCSQELRDELFISRYKTQHILWEVEVINIHLMPTVERLKEQIIGRNLGRDQFHQTNWDTFKAGLQTSHPLWDCDKVKEIEYADPEVPLAMSLRFLADLILES
ncbi:MAG: AAA family ATPase [Sphaerochaeta sp.]|nr:AAA family ATPase [Sphaerochaeta sp.]